MYKTFAYNTDFELETSDIFCGVGMSSGSQVCQGDSGGPLFFEFQGHLVQVGVTVWTDGGCVAQLNGFLKLQHHVKWIMGVVDSGLVGRFAPGRRRPNRNRKKKT